MKIIIKYIHGLINQIINKEIIAKDESHLRELIRKEIKYKGLNCNLNHINVSKITNMNKLFEKQEFNGDISQWDVSNVKSMAHMFFCSKFNGDISNWNISKVEDMEHMFHGAIFNKDISKWDISNVKDMSFMFASSHFKKDISSWNVSNALIMEYMFYQSNFKKDLSNWRPYHLQYANKIFEGCDAPIPYWVNYDNATTRSKAIDSYLLSEDLDNELDIKVSKSNKKLKI